MTVDRRKFISGLAAIAAPAVAMPAGALVVGTVKLDYPLNPQHVLAMIYLRKTAKKILSTGEFEFEEISATCRFLCGETGTYNPWHTSLYLFDIMYRATEHLGAMGLNKSEINVALGRLDAELEIKRRLGIKVPESQTV